jgi:hypothetical protein
MYINLLSLLYGLDFKQLPTIKKQDCSAWCSVDFYLRHLGAFWWIYKTSLANEL